MPIDREIPDSHVTSLANQFCTAAEHLFNSLEVVNAPNAMRCNAVFAIELFIKSLNCHWVRHNQWKTLGIDCDAITVEPDVRGHKLDKLFEALNPDAQQHLIDAFAEHRLNQKYPGLRPILAEYSDNFIIDRYIFDRIGNDCDHPLIEIIELATFFRETINKMNTIRV